MYEKTRKVILPGGGMTENFIFEIDWMNVWKKVYFVKTLMISADVKCF